MNNTAAFFDMDRTIIWENSGLSSVRFAWKNKLIPTRALALGAYRMLLYRLTLLEIDEWYDRVVEKMKGTPVKTAEEFSLRWFESMVKWTIYKEAVELIESHRDSGDRLVIISNALEFVVGPLARTLSIDDMLCTRVEKQDGVLTGKIIKPLCQGAGKRDRALEWASMNEIDMEGSHFYTDSFYDIELMNEVGHPVATNPDMRLRSLARKNEWEILDFKKIPAFRSLVFK